MDKVGFDRPNAVCGGFFMLTGLIFGYQSLQVDLGSWLRIGPGGLPLVLSGLLIVLGAVIFGQALRIEGEPVGPAAWRGMLFILLAPVIFGLTVRGLGFVGSVFATSLFASFASVRMKPLTALLLAVALTLFSTAVFSYGLGLPFPRVGPWLRW